MSRTAMSLPIGLTALALTAVALAATAAPAVADDRGTFEEPSIPAGGVGTYHRGDRIGPWRVVGGSVDVTGRGRWQTIDGVQALDLSGSIRRTFSTRPGHSYQLTYWLARHPGAPPVVTGAVAVNDTPPVDFAVQSARTALGWTRQAVTFQATGAQTPVEFRGTTTAGSGPALDAVSVRPTP